MRFAICLLLLSARSAWAQGEAASTAHAPPELRSGAIELGVAGALSSVAGNLHSTLALRSGTFRRAAHGLAGGELELAHTHSASLDVLDLEAHLSWQPSHRGLLHPFASLDTGWEEEWLGSFRQARFPVGVTLGARLLHSNRAAARFEYSYRRLLHDPIADFSQHELLLGLSLLFRNAP